MDIWHINALNVYLIHRFDNDVPGMEGLGGMLFIMVIVEVFGARETSVDFEKLLTQLWLQILELCCTNFFYDLLYQVNLIN